VVRRHAPVVLKAILAGLVVTGLWRFVIEANEWHLGEKSTEPLMFVVIVVAAFIYSLLLSVIVGSVYDQYRSISKAVVTNNLDEFLVYRDEQVPILMHILIGAVSVVILAGTLLLDYQHEVVTGMLSSFFVTFMLAIGWSVTNELDNFERSIWFKVNIPKRWYQIDIKTHFGSETLEESS
jgi:hypothetical protein